MFKGKIKQLANTVKQSVNDTYRLLWQFKWYVGFDMLFFIILLSEYINPPAQDDMIWKSEATNGLWYYQNQQLYMQSCKYSMIISLLFFLLATSNMRNHSKMAKVIFLFPLYAGWLGLL